MSYNYLPLDSTYTRFRQFKNLHYHNQLISVTFQAYEAIDICRKYLDKKADESDALYYGINTGFGYLQNVHIGKSDVKTLQYNLLKSHACGVGGEVPSEIVKLMLALKVKSLGYGYSGVQNETVQRLIDLHNHEVYPVIYEQGSLGASGDLSPLSHLCLPLIGLGEVSYKGKRYKGSELEQLFGWKPVELKSKEGLALINGTQFMSAYGMWCLIKSERLIEWANLIAALSIEGFNCNLSAFHPLIHQIRSHAGQVKTASVIRDILDGSELINCPGKEVQDPYSFRCIPQVHGASEDTYNYVLSVFMKEFNSVTDNPNVFPEDDVIASGGNFHGQPLALALDFLAIGMSELANISERRTYQLISGQRNLPLFLVKDAGLNSGFMIPQYTAASIVSQNKQLCTPASVDSISSSNNQEDHVSMGANGATKCKRVVDNLESVLAIELLTAAQAFEFRRPLKSSAKIERLFSLFRKEVSFNNEDRVMHDDIQSAIAFLRNNNPSEL